MQDVSHQQFPSSDRQYLSALRLQHTTLNKVRNMSLGSAFQHGLRLRLLKASHDEGRFVETHGEHMTRSCYSCSKLYCKVAILQAL